MRSAEELKGRFTKFRFMLYSVYMHDTFLALVYFQTSVHIKHTTVFIHKQQDLRIPSKMEDAGSRKHRR